MEILLKLLFNLVQEKAIVFVVKWLYHYVYQVQEILHRTSVVLAEFFWWIDLYNLGIWCLVHVVHVVYFAFKFLSDYNNISPSSLTCNEVL